MGASLRSPSPMRHLLFQAARVILFILVILHIAQTVLGLPAAYQNLVNLTPNSGMPGWTQADMQAATQSLGISPQFLAIVLFSTSLICLLTFWIVAWLLFWKKGDSIIGLLSFFVLTGVGVGFSYLIPDASNLTGIVKTFYNADAVLIWITFFVLLYLFPNGSFVPRWTRYLLPVPIGIALMLLVYADNEPAWPGGVAIAYLIGGGISQVYRFLRVSNAEQRQQTKWIVLVIGIFAAINLANPILQLFFPSTSAKTPAIFLSDIFGNYILTVLITSLLPVSIAISIMRYRLWDIDLIIRKTLIYTVVTGLLALVYFGIVLLLQAMFSALGFDKSPAALVISTLASATLFNPLRRRVQEAIDHRFYRRKYDAQKAVAAFAEKSRDEVDIDRLNLHLLAVIRETVQPRDVSIWVREINSAARQGGKA